MNSQGKALSVGLDPSFGEGGTTSFGLPGMSYGATLCVTPSNRIVAVGMPGDSTHTIVLARFEQDGAIDPTFGADGVATLEMSADLEHVVHHCLALADERVVLLGKRNVPGYLAQDYFFTCVRADGTLDTSFGNAGTTVVAPTNRNFHAWSMLFHGQGKILAHFEGVQMPENYRANALVRLNPDGHFDTSFGTGGIHYVERDLRLPDCVARPDGRLLMAGTEGLYSVVRGYDAAGQPDLAFGDGGVAQLPSPTGEEMYTERLALQDDGRILVQGLLASSSDNPRSYLMKLRPDGERDPSFNRGEPLILPRISGRGMVVESSGRVLALEREELADKAQLRSLTPDGFDESPPFQLPLAGPVYHFPEEQLLRHVPGTLLVSANITDPQTQTRRLTISRLLI
ncbi:hypothetical protein V0R50_15725 [Pseudomonas sp. 148P]|uniref:Delta-60 repeat domain-containing protein n=1 Tax=Pseudomonas ulcerans TaxID=3115852 RepID=A0ABU7HT65_9PSED|nr:MULTISPECIES: hypothetical protein [unclassified Pseudomonas]MEE1924075.1 hypothetical protein [Pseudomonas sp. 147P]MEE1934678.1 hypothetical protein [Pseudomonas sp. 148P]